jgi:hypothetical protein
MGCQIWHYFAYICLYIDIDIGPKVLRVTTRERLSTIAWNSPELERQKVSVNKDLSLTSSRARTDQSRLPTRDLVP